MTATSGKQFAIGMRHVRVYELDSNGFIAPTASTAYDGYQAVGAKAFEINIPDARRIAHTGDDQILAQDILPRQEVSSGTLRLGRNDYDIHAILTATLEATIGEAKVIGYGTSQQGSEPDVAILMYQQSLDATTKVRRWRSYLLPATRAVITPASMSESAPEFVYQLVPQIATQYPWGIDFASGTEGYTSAEITEIMTENVPHICAWKAGSSQTEFDFSASYQAVSTDKIHVVTKNGVAVTSGLTKAVDKLTFGVAPTENDIIICFYEVAA